MFKIIAVAAVLVSGCLSAAAGEAAAAPKTERIGVVYIQQVFKNYNFAKDTEERIKQKYQPEQAQIEAEIARIMEMDRALQNNPLKAPQSPAWRKSMMEIEAAKVEVQSNQEEFARRVREEEAAFWVNMYNAFQRACKVLAEYYAYDVIIAAPDPILSEEAVKAMDPMAIQQEILMRRVQYVGDKANLTSSITELLNHNYTKHLQNPTANPL
jgi:Outer membrane protein